MYLFVFMLDGNFVMFYLIEEIFKFLYVNDVFVLVVIGYKINLLFVIVFCLFDYILVDLLIGNFF